MSSFFILAHIHQSCCLHGLFALVVFIIVLVVVNVVIVVLVNVVVVVVIATVNATVIVHYSGIQLSSAAALFFCWVPNTAQWPVIKKNTVRGHVSELSLSIIFL